MVIETTPDHPVMHPDISQAQAQAQAHSLALGRLSRRESSAAMIKEYLERQGVAPEIADHEIASLIQLGYLSDTRFTRVFVRTMLLRKRGASYIQRALAQRGVTISDADLRAVIDELEPNAEHHGIISLLERKYALWREDSKVKEKATRGLLARGYSYSQIQKVFQDWEI